MSQTINLTRNRYFSALSRVAVSIFFIYLLGYTQLSFSAKSSADNAASTSTSLNRVSADNLKQEKQEKVIEDLKNQLENAKNKLESSAEFLNRAAFILGALSVLATFFGIVVPIYQYFDQKPRSRKLKKLGEKLQLGLKTQEYIFIVNSHILAILKSHFDFLWRLERNNQHDSKEADQFTPKLPPASASSLQIETIKLQSWLLGLATQEQDEIKNSLDML